MKYLTAFLIFISFSFSTYACSCAGEQSFCNHIQSTHFLNNDGIICIAESTGNTAGNYDFRAFEMKLITLMSGTIQPGSGTYTNTDSIFWIILGQSATCYEGIWLGNAGDQFVMAPVYGELFTFTDLTEIGYSLFLCTHDVFPYQDTMIGPIINDTSFFPEHVWAIDTVSSTQLPQIVADCTNSKCLLNLDLSGMHNMPFTYQAGSTITSKATVNANVLYKAGDRIRLETGFKTNQAINFGASIHGCN